MSNVNPRQSRSNFFPGAKSSKSRASSLNLRRNSAEKIKEIESSTKHDVKIDITNKVKDFARIKSATDKTLNIDNSAKIADLKRKGLGTVHIIWTTILLQRKCCDPSFKNEVMMDNLVIEEIIFIWKRFCELHHQLYDATCREYQFLLEVKWMLSMNI